jgi:hypothetical protein
MQPMTSDENTNPHPLKQLRAICGLSQVKLAEVTGLHLDVIRAAEIGRRKRGELSERQLEQILFSTGALWDPEARDWIFIFTRNALRAHQGVPYKREHYQGYRNELTTEARERAGAIGYLLLRLLYFLESVPNEKFNGEFWRLRALLDKLGAKKLPMSLSPNWEPDELRAMGYVKEFFWLDEGNEQKFAELIDAYRTERELRKKRGLKPSDEDKKPTSSVPSRGKRLRQRQT